VLVVLDVNETLLDLRPLDPVLGDEAVRRRWFDLLIRATIVSAAVGEYRDFGALALEAARTVLDDAATDDRLAALARTMRALPPHPDVEPGLRALRDGGHRLVTLTNSSPATAEAQLEHAGLRPFVEAVYSIEHAGVAKPGAGAYRFVLEAEGVEPAGALMVAAHDWDIAGAGAVGMRTALVRRQGVRPMPGFPSPDHSVERVDELASLLV